MIVCICNNISEREIRQAADLGVTTMEELSNDLGVATCCGQCHRCATDVLNEHLRSSAAVSQPLVFHPAVFSH
jgi:bacterioferritin-associated ferredoxin